MFSLCLSTPHCRRKPGAPISGMAIADITLLSGFQPHTADLDKVRGPDPSLSPPTHCTSDQPPGGTPTSSPHGGEEQACLFFHESSVYLSIPTAERPG